MITDQDIEQAEARVTDMKERAARLRMANREEAADAVRLEVGRLTEMKERRSAQEEALKARKVAERPHLPELKKMSAQLSDSAEKVDKARHDAAEALSRLISAVHSHNGSIGVVHARVEELGVPAGDKVVDLYDAGYGSAGALRISGTTWTPLPADTLTMYAVAQVMSDAFGPKHPEARVRDARVHTLLRSGFGLLKAA
ncbi:hypothetical protein [Streptomyces sp900105755]|uniref:Uncharacterized protein n=1 Tax=Streptomyces sp. 900105755 TaxID=3154389 RepID=A0ABV1TNB1_9ACTN